MAIDSILLEFADRHGFIDQLIALSKPEIDLANAKWNKINHGGNFRAEEYARLLSVEQRLAFFTGKGRIVELPFLAIAYDRGLVGEVLNCEGGFLERYSKKFGETELVRRVVERIAADDYELAKTALTIRNVRYDFTDEYTTLVVFELVAAGVISPEVLAGQTGSLHGHLMLQQEAEEYLSKTTFAAIGSNGSSVQLSRIFHGSGEPIIDNGLARDCLVLNSLGAIRRAYPPAFELLASGILPVEQFLQWFKDQPIGHFHFHDYFDYEGAPRKMYMNFGGIEQIIPLAELKETNPQAHAILLRQIRDGENLHALGYTREQLNAFVNIREFLQEPSVAQANLQRQEPENDGWVIRFIGAILDMF